VHAVVFASLLTLLNCVSEGFQTSPFPFYNATVAETLITNAAYTSDAQDITNDWLFSLAAPTDIKGVVLWTPGSSPYGGGDAPMKKVNFVWTDCNNVEFSKQIELGLPSPNAKIFYLLVLHQKREVDKMNIETSIKFHKEHSEPFSIKTSSLSVLLLFLLRGLAYPR
jgi:hypothetical protein